MSFGPFEMAIVLVLVLILFGAGKLPQVFESMGQGIKKFREAQREDEPSPPVKEIPGRARVSEAEEIRERHEAE